MSATYGVILFDYYDRLFPCISLKAALINCTAFLQQSKYSPLNEEPLILVFFVTIIITFCNGQKILVYAADPGFSSYIFYYTNALLLAG